MVKHIQNIAKAESDTMPIYPLQSSCPFSKSYVRICGVNNALISPSIQHVKATVFSVFTVLGFMPVWVGEIVCSISS